MKKYASYIASAVILAVLITFSMTTIGKSAITELSGLAVAQTGSLWKNVRDFMVSDNIPDGVLAAGMVFYDATGMNADRLRGSIANGVLVDVTRSPGSSQTPADSFANPTTFQGTWSLLGYFNDTTWDRWRGQVVPVQGPTLLNTQTLSAANTAITLTLTGVSGKRIHLYSMSAGCTGGASSTYTISDIAQVDSGIVPPNTMLFSQTWPVGYTAPTAGNLVIVIGACGTGNIGILNVQADRF